MFELRRHLRIWATMTRLGLVREMAFRVNFLVKVSVEVSWLFLALVFYDAVLTHTGSDTVAGWTRAEFLFFVGCYFALEGFIETLFLSNCGAFADLVRSGELDFILLRPIDEQFLVSLRNVDWSMIPNILIGFGVITYALVLLEWQFTFGQALLFIMLFLCGLGLAYSVPYRFTSAISCSDCPVKLISAYHGRGEGTRMSSLPALADGNRGTEGAPG